jgi:hypothetical protein
MGVTRSAAVRTLQELVCLGLQLLLLLDLVLEFINAVFDRLELGIVVET